jgi:hypothetical protein
MSGYHLDEAARQNEFHGFERRNSFWRFATLREKLLCQIYATSSAVLAIYEEIAFEAKPLRRPS